MKKKKISNIISNIVLVIAICVLIFAGYKLFGIFMEYKAGSDEYDALREYVAETTPAPEPEAEVSPGEPAGEPEPADTKPVPPITVDFAQLQQINPDIVGWIYIEAIPKISYPVVRGEDNDYYLHHTVEGVRNSSASIFMDFHNKGDFSDTNTIVYGHNMKNQSMFGLLKNLRDQSVYDQSPYFWILTPENNYRYEVFSARAVPYDDEVYTLYSAGGEEFRQYLEKMQAASDVKNSITFTGNEKAITLSTCTSSETVRCVIQGVRKEE